jgi:predicted RNA-binding protein YlqC (UPF0109 family)
MLELVEFIVEKLIPDGDYDIGMIENDDSSDIMLTVAKKDIGKVIGKQGRIAKSIRMLVKAGSSGSSRRYNLVIDEKPEEKTAEIAEVAIEPAPGAEETDAVTEEISANEAE